MFTVKHWITFNWGSRWFTLYDKKI